MGSIGGGKNKSSSQVVDYRKLLTPEQLKAISLLGPQLTSEALAAFQGYGFTPSERLRQEQQLMGNISDYASSMRDSVLSGYATRNVEGGVKDAFYKNLDAAKLMAYSAGLGDIEQMNQDLVQQKIANALGFMTWSPPHTTTEKSSGWNFDVSLFNNKKRGP